ncbi:MAG: hypothetical protein ABMA64_09800 [Myxococcota bacterium]
MIVFLGAAFARPHDGDELVALLAEIRAAGDAGNVAGAAAMTRALLVDPKALARVLVSDAPPSFVDAVVGAAEQWSDDSDAVVARYLTPAGRTECRAYAATTEAIAAGADEFPGGAVQLAKRVMAPGVTWLEVSCTEPGAALGTRFHLFFHDGRRWRMLGPAWRWLEDPSSRVP